MSVTKPLKPPRKSLRDKSSETDEDHGQQEGDNVDCDPTFEASCSSSEAGLLTQEDSNDFVRDFNLSKTSWTLRFSTKRVETSPPKY